MTKNDVRPLQHCPAPSRAPDVLPVLPLVRCQADSALGYIGNRGDGLSRPKEGGPDRLDGLWALGGPASLVGQRHTRLGPRTVRAPESGETPLSPSEAAIAMRDFPNEISL